MSRKALENTNPSAPLSFLFFCSRPNFSRRTRAETLARQARHDVPNALSIFFSIIAIFIGIPKLSQSPSLLISGSGSWLALLFAFPARKHKKSAARALRS